MVSFSIIVEKCVAHSFFFFGEGTQPIQYQRKLFSLRKIVVEWIVTIKKKEKKKGFEMETHSHQH